MSNFSRYSYSYNQQPQQQSQAPTQQSPSYGSYSDSRASTTYQPATSVAQPSTYNATNLQRDSYSTNQNAYSASNARSGTEYYGYGNAQGSTSYDRGTSGTSNAARADTRYATANSDGSNSYRAAYAGASGQPHSAQGSSAQNVTQSGPYGYARGQSQQRPDSVNSVGSAGSHPTATNPRASHLGATSNATTTQTRSPLQTHQSTSYTYQPANNDHQRRVSSGAYQAPGSGHQQQQQQPQSSSVAQQTSQNQQVRQPSQQQDQRSTPSHEPSAATVDPTQVYDNSHELQRQAAKRRAEAEAAAQAEATRRKVEDDRKAKEAEEASVAAAQEAAKAKPKKKRASKADQQKSKDDAAAAAMTLMQTANANGGSMSAEADEEAQMRAMFAKMREFNSKNPEMLSRLWAQEREEHLANAQAPQAASPAAAGAPAPAKQAGPKPNATSSDKPKKSHKKKPPPTQTTGTQGSAGAGASSSQPTTTAAPPAAPKPSPKTQGTIWPADKKASLSAAASSLLMQMPENQGKRILPDEIAQILNTNPSYDQLCSQIEAKGIRMNKFQFARSLLSAVPGVSKTASATASATSPQMASGNVASAPADSAVNSLMNQPSIVDTPRKKGGKQRKEGSPSQAKSKGASQASPTGIPSGLEGLEAVKDFNEHGSTISTTSPARPRAPRHKPSITPLPQTKEDLARKRTFGDLVDLTQLSDEEPPPKRVNVDDQLPTPPQTVAADSDTSKKDQLVAPPAPAPVGPAGPAAPTAPMAQVHHPSAQQFTAPLAPMQPTKDQSAAPLKQRIPRNHPIQSVVICGKIDRRDAIRRSTYNAKTIARDVLLACGRHPDMRHLNAHMDSLRTNLPHVRDDSDLSTLRWDVIDAGGLAVGSNAVDEPLDIGADFADDEDDLDSVFDEPQAASVPVVTASGSGPERSSMPFSRRGRPRKSDPGFRRVASGTNTPNAPSKPATSASAGPAASQSNTYTALREAQKAQGITPTRGRPKGWRKYMQKSDGAPGPSHATPRPAGTKPSHHKRPKSPSPDFPVYKCRWEGCKAELHNLDVLRRHLHKLHCKPGVTIADPSGASYSCIWASCGHVMSKTEQGRNVSRFTRHAFPSAQVWRGHVEEEHLKPVAWELGDGPAAGLSDRGESAGELSEQYMSDRDGRRVTPRVEMPDNAVDATARARERGVDSVPPGVGRAGGRLTPHDEASNEEWAVSQRRRRLGAGIDVGGSPIVTDEAREGFNDAEESMEVVDEV